MAFSPASSGLYISDNKQVVACQKSSFSNSRARHSCHPVSALLLSYSEINLQCTYTFKQQSFPARFPQWENGDVPVLLHDVEAYGVLCNSVCFFVPPVLQVCQGASRGRGTVSVPFVWLSISNAQTAKANFMKLVREGGPTEIWSWSRWL